MGLPQHYALFPGFRENDLAGQLSSDEESAGKRFAESSICERMLLHY